MADDAQYDPYSGIDTPESLQAQKYAQFQRQMQLAQPQNTGAMFGAQTQGMLLGQGLAGAIGQVLPTQQMQQARQNAAVMQKAAGMTPDQLEALASSGQVPAAMAQPLMNRANLMRQQQSTLATNQSTQLKNTGEYLKAIQQGRPATPQELAAYTQQNGKLPTGYGLVIKADGTPEVIGAKEGVNVNVAAEDKLAPLVFDQMGKANDIADTNLHNIALVDQARQSLANGAIVGPGAEVRQKIAGMLGAMGMSDMQQYMGDTAMYNSITTQLAAGTAKGLVNRLTNYELNLFKAVNGGDMTQIRQALDAVLANRCKYFASQVQVYNDRYDKLSGKNDVLGQTVSRTYSRKDIPAESSPTAAPKTQWVMQNGQLVKVQ